jgi:hypothetical protein
MYPICQLAPILTNTGFAGMGRGAVDERGFETVRRIRNTLSDFPLAHAG